MQSFLLLTAFIISNNAAAEQPEPLPGSSLALAGSLTVLSGPLLSMANSSFYTLTGAELGPAPALTLPVGLTMSHYGNKKMLRSMAGQVNDDAYNWGQRFSQISLYSGAIGLGVIFTGVVLAEQSSNPSTGTGVFILGGLLGGVSGVCLIPASISYEVQRQRTKRAYQASGRASLEQKPMESHFTISLQPRHNGLSLMGTF